MSWRVPITTAMPAVKPVVTGYGTYSMNWPIRAAPMAKRIRPAARVARSSPPRPKRVAIGARTTTKAAVGPETWTGEPPSSAMMKPATIAV